MSLLKRYRYFCTVLAIFVCTCAWAGGPTPVLIIGGNTTNFTSTGVGTPTTQTITLNFDGNGTSGQGASLTALAIAGANFGDFAIIGGSCNPGTTVLSQGTNCTVIVRYTPSSSANEAAELDGTCATVGLVGGFTLSCTGVSGELFSLAGAVVAAAITQLPMLDPKMLTLLFALLFALGVYYANRKRT